MRSMFGDCDKDGENRHGKIINTNPLWTKDKQVADMRDDIREIEQQEEDNLFVSGKAKALKKARKVKLQKRLSQIEASDPRGKIKGRELDKVRDVVSNFAEEVRQLNPTKADNDAAIKAGESTLSPAEQSRFSKTRCIQLKNDNEIEAAKACNLVIDENNMVSRDDMTRAIWMLQPILGVRPSHLSLRMDKPAGHINKTSQFLIGDLPPDMQAAHEKFVKDLRAKHEASKK